jgi:hypothetical protein
MANMAASRNRKPTSRRLRDEKKQLGQGLQLWTRQVYYNHLLIVRSLKVIIRHLRLRARAPRRHRGLSLLLSFPAGQGSW